jgi:hypothetical protein
MPLPQSSELAVSTLGPRPAGGHGSKDKKNCPLANAPYCRRNMTPWVNRITRSSIWTVFSRRVLEKDVRRVSEELATQTGEAPVDASEEICLKQMISRLTELGVGPRN